MTRKDTKVINIGGRKIGGGNPVAIQSMTNTKTEDVEATVAQILALEKAGCDVTLLSIENGDHPLRCSNHGSGTGFKRD